MAKNTAPVEAAEAEAIVEPAPEPTVAELALAAKVGEQVIGPVTGETLIVQHKFRAGGVLLTGDGEGMYGGESPALAKGEEIPAEQLITFEFVGGERDGQWGQLNRKRGDNRAVVTNTPA
jgi:hypothetical protein